MPPHISPDLLTILPPRCIGNVNNNLSSYRHKAWNLKGKADHIYGSTCQVFHLSTPKGRKTSQRNLNLEYSDRRNTAEQFARGPKGYASNLPS